MFQWFLYNILQHNYLYLHYVKYSNFFQKRERSEDCVLLVSFGNPLLDATAVVEDTALHKKFKLPKDGQLEVNDSQKELFSLVPNK